LHSVRPPSKPKEAWKIMRWQRGAHGHEKKKPSRQKTN
jgi:hypothetical protein